MTANIENFKPLDAEKQIVALANLLPNGLAWRAKNIKGTKFYDTLKAMSYEFSRIDSSVYALASEFIPSKQMGFVENWEKFLGIPDCCLTIEVPIENRILNIIAKFGYLNLFSEQDYYDLAELYGITIVNFDNSVFGQITITIQSSGEPPDNVFDMDYNAALAPEGAFIFGSFEERFFSCLVSKYAPAFVEVIVNSVYV